MKDKIIVVGELNVDLILSGLTAFPALGQEVLADGMRLVMGSSSAICAAGLARLGARVDFVGKVGVDDYGDLVTDQLRALGVGVDHIIHDDTVRTGVTISLTYPEDRALITYMGTIPLLDLGDVNTSILQQYNHLHVSSYFLQQGLRPGLPELFRQAHRAGLTVSLDTGYDPHEEWGGNELLALLENVDVFIPNGEEARAIARADNAEAALRELAKRAGLVVVKCGPDGAMAIQDGQVLHSPGFHIDMVDTTGAGDSFNAGFIFAYIAQGMPLPQALRFANACGALSATGVGGTAAQPTPEQVHTFLEEQSQ